MWQRILRSLGLRRSPSPAEPPPAATAASAPPIDYRDEAFQARLRTGVHLLKTAARDPDQEAAVLAAAADVFDYLEVALCSYPQAVSVLPRNYQVVSPLLGPGALGLPPLCPPPSNAPPPAGYVPATLPLRQPLSLWEARYFSHEVATGFLEEVSAFVGPPWSDRIAAVAGPPAVCEPRWRTADVLGLARGIADDRAFDRLPILADALLEAGCDDSFLLAHCRMGPERAGSWWVVGFVLGKWGPHLMGGRDGLDRDMVLARELRTAVREDTNKKPLD